MTCERLFFGFMYLDSMKALLFLRGASITGVAKLVDAHKVVVKRSEKGRPTL